jgi:hypothetical protein
METPDPETEVEKKAREDLRVARRMAAMQNLVNHGFIAGAGGDVWFKLGEVFLLRETPAGEWEIVAL